MIQIHGKNYITVNERIQTFHEKYPQGSIETEISYEGNQIVRCKALVKPEASRLFTGHAEERRDDGNINKTSAVENCETSAVGRALAMLGIGVEESVASADEIAGALKRENRPTYYAPKKQESEPKKTGLEEVKAKAAKLGSEGARKTLAARMQESGKYSNEEITYATGVETQDKE